MSVDRLTFGYGESRQYQFEISVESYAKIYELGQRHHRGPEEVFRAFIIMGLVAARLEEEPGSAFVIVKDGARHQVELFSDKAYPIQRRRHFLGFFEKVAKVRGEYSTEIAIHLQELANRKHTTVEALLKEFFSIGVDIAQADDDSNAAIIVRDGTGEYEFRLFDV